MLGGVLPSQLYGVGKSLAAALRDVPVQTPGSFAIVKARPGRSYRNLVGILRLHSLVEVFEIGFSPVAAIRRPARFAGIDPGIQPIKGGGVGSGIVLIDQQRSRI